jgi:hypothetical protein
MSCCRRLVLRSSHTAARVRGTQFNRLAKDQVTAATGIRRMRLHRRKRKSQTSWSVASGQEQLPPRRLPLTSSPCMYRGLRTIRLRWWWRSSDWSLRWAWNASAFGAGLTSRSSRRPRIRQKTRETTADHSNGQPHSQPPGSSSWCCPVCDSIAPGPALSNESCAGRENDKSRISRLLLYIT